MKSLFEVMGGTYTLGEDGMYYPNLELPTNSFNKGCTISSGISRQ